MKKKGLNKWKVSLVVFWVALMVLVVDWGSISEKIKEIHGKPFITQDAQKNYTQKCQTILESARLKGETLTPDEFNTDMLTLLKSRFELAEKWNVPSDMSINFNKRYSKIFYQPLKDRLIKEERLGDLNRSHIRIWEMHNHNGLFGDEINFGLFLSIMLFGVKFWLLGSVLVIFLYAYRCRLMGKSFKELVLLQPGSFASHVVFWLMGLSVKYPGGTISAAKRYHEARSSYMWSSGKKCLSDQEEQALWQKIMAPIETFDRNIARVFVYSRTFALISTIMIWTASLSKGVLKASEVTKKEVSTITETAKVTELNLSGFLQFKTEFSKDKNTFNIPFAVVTLKSKLNEILDWKLELDFSNKRLRDAWIKLAIDDWIKLKAGRWWASYTVTPNPSYWYLVEHPKATSLATMYAVGLRLEGDIGLIKYYLGVINGNGSQLEDDNEEKDVYAHLQFRPFKWLSVGTAIQRGEQPEGMRTKYKGHLRLNFQNIHTIVLSEYFAEETEGSARKFGWYLIAAWNPWKKIGFACQYNFLNNGEVEKKDLTFGINYFPLEGLKIQVNYEIGNLGDKALARFQIRF